MDHLVGEYLVSGRAAPQTTAPQSLLIVETRRSFWLPLVIKNAKKEFSNWVLWVLGPREVIDFVTRECAGVDFRAVVSDLPRKCTPATFSAIMFSPQLWNLFDTDFVMIFQLDTVFAPGAAAKLPNPADRDYYGAACGSLSHQDFVINGGLSYRRVSAFRDACRLLTDEDRALPEDVAFCRVMRRHPQFRLPSLRECMAFAIESFGDPFSAVGIHGTDKGYCPPGLLAAVVGSGRYVDVFPYDGEPILETRLKLLWNLVDVFVVVEARQTHSGLPKEPAFDLQKFAAYASKIRHVVIDAFPPMPPGFGATLPWVRPESAEAWWREAYQRDYFVTIPDLPADATYIVSDVDEIPDPYVLATLDPVGIAHLDMAFLVHRPCWQKREPWARAFVSAGKPSPSPTAIRCSRPSKIVENAGWHCSSFFDVDSQVRKLRHYAHREHAETAMDPEVIRRRFETGKDPYGRSADYDCVRTDQHQFLEFV